MVSVDVKHHVYILGEAAGADVPDPKTFTLVKNMSFAFGDGFLTCGNMNVNQKVPLKSWSLVEGQSLDYKVDLPSGPVLG